MADEISLLIDGDQVTPAQVGTVLKRLERSYTVSERLCIRNWRSSKDVAEWKTAASEYALRCLQRDPVATGKNASDIELAIEAMDQYHRLGMRNFCLISADTDFTPLVERLRRGGCDVDWVRDTKAMSKATATRKRAAAREGGRSKKPTEKAPAKKAPAKKAPAKKAPQRSGRTPTGPTPAAAKAVRRAISEIRKTGKHDKGAVAVQRIGQWLADHDVDRADLGGSKSAPLWKALQGMDDIGVEQREDGRYWVTMD